MNNMRALQHYLQQQPTRSNKPLSVSLLLSTAITAIILSMISMPRWDVLPAATPVILELDIESQERPDPPDISSVPEQASINISDAPSIDDAVNDISSDEWSVPTDETANTTAVEWYALLDRIVTDLISDADAQPSMSPQLDELRRVARIRFAPVVDNGPRPIWENVETDQIGRTILRFGDCYRVLVDWRVTNRWAQENFGQYIVYCDPSASSPKELPFVAQIVERYDYLQE